MFRHCDIEIIEKCSIENDFFIADGEEKFELKIEKYDLRIKPYIIKICCVITFRNNFPCAAQRRRLDKPLLRIDNHLVMTLSYSVDTCKIILSQSISAVVASLGFPVPESD